MLKYNQSMTASFYWHDYETFGINPRWARPSQFAGVRTDIDLNIVGEPLMIYCQPPIDSLPDPEACLITGITPQQCLQRGLPEYQFAKKIMAELLVKNTCAVGYNSIRFDDEFTRHLLYRNFYDPYAREWQNGNSRWDILDVVRLMYALRPEGMVWPLSEDEQDKGRPIFKLEALSKANGLQHEAAHDALSDVMATIALAKKIKSLQPKLFDYAFSLRLKNEVEAQLDLANHKPIFHVSSKLKWQHGYAALMMPLCRHAVNKNGVICFDLSADPNLLLDLSAEEIAARVFTKIEDLPAGAERVPLKMIHINKSPMVGSVKLLDDQAAQRLNIDSAQCAKNWKILLAGKEKWLAKVSEVMSREFEQDSTDPEFNLYNGFINSLDRKLCDEILHSSGHELSKHSFPFADKRLPEMLFRYRARNFPETLNKEEQHQWEEFRFQRLNEKICEDAFDLESYHLKIAELSSSPLSRQKQHGLLNMLSEWGDQIL